MKVNKFWHIFSFFGGVRIFDIVVSLARIARESEMMTSQLLSLVPTAAAARWWRHLRSSPEAVMAADGLPSQHAYRLLCVNFHIKIRSSSQNTQ